MKSYYVNTKQILSQIEREISRVAVSAYSDNGTPLYDAIIPYTRDRVVLEEMIEDALSAMLTRLSDVASLSSDSDGFELWFDIPEERTHDIDTIGKVIDRFVMMNVCSAWMLQKYPIKAEEFGARSTDALDKVERLLREKLPPIVPTHNEN